MIAALASAGKSLLALWLSVQWVKRDGLLGFYYSSDSAELGQAARALAMSTDAVTIHDAGIMLDKQESWAINQMRSLNRLFWSFESDMSYESIYEELLAFVELWGDVPDFMVVDNLTDIDGQDPDEVAKNARALKALKQLARKTGAAVIVLHHVSEDTRSWKGDCPPRWTVMGKIVSQPALVLTMSDRGRTRPVACVKNRFGDDDRAGINSYPLRFNPENMHFASV
jgi:RecA-family ATPase